MWYMYVPSYKTTRRYRAFFTNPADQVYLQRAADLRAGPYYTPNQDAVVWVNKKLAWGPLKQIFNEEKNTDAVLLDRFL